MPGTVYIIANVTRVVQKCRARFAFLWFVAQRSVESFKNACVIRLTPFAPLVLFATLVAASLIDSPSAWAVPSNHTIANTVNADYLVNGNAFNYSSSVNIVTDNNAGNSAPTGIVIDDPEVEENASGAIISSVLVEDLDPDDTHTFVVSDNRFEVVDDELKLVDGVFLDFESEPSVSLSVTATDPDGASVTQDFVITVLNVNEAPYDIDLSDSNLQSNSPGALVGVLSTVDPDAGDTFAYSLADPRFEIVDSELRLRDDESLPPGTTVNLEIVVIDAGGLTYSEVFVIETLQNSAPSEIEFSILTNGFASGGMGSPENLTVAVSQCSLSSDLDGSYADNPDPTSSQGEAISVPGMQDLLPTELYKSGETVFFQLNDTDANLDSLEVDFVIATISSSTGDVEIVRFFETNIDTGIFAGYVQTTNSTVAAYDCVLSVGENTAITIEYTDAFDSTDVSSASALIDPLSIVFESGTGQPINGVRVTIVDALTGQPAEVYGDLALSAFPNSILTGGSGADYQFSDGEYRFPYLLAGQYKLLVEPPNRFAFPSQVADSDLQTLPGAPYQLSAASRGDTLLLGPSSVFQVDIPLDLVEITPSASSLELFVSTTDTSNSDGLLTIGNSQCRIGDTFQVQPDPITLAGTIELPARLVLTKCRDHSIGRRGFCACGGSGSGCKSLCTRPDYGKHPD